MLFKKYNNKIKGDKMEYHKINGLYKRYRKDLHKEVELPKGTSYGDFIEGEFSKEEFEYLFNNQWVWSEKLDGTNIRIYLWFENEDEEWFTIKGRTDRAILPKPLEEWIKDYLRNNYTLLKDTFKDSNVILYGEGVGEKIQKVGHYYGEQHFKLFDIFIGGYYLEKDNVRLLGEKLKLDTPKYWYGTIKEAIDRVKRLPKSYFGDFTIEGYVGQPLVRLLNTNKERIITKIKVVDFVK